MHRFSIVVGQIFALLFGNDSRFIIFARHSPDCVNRIPKHDRDELDFSASLSPQQVAASVAFHFANTREKFRLQHGLVGIGVLRLGVSVPDSCDHAILFCKDAPYGARRFEFSSKVQGGPLYSWIVLPPSTTIICPVM